MNKVVGKPRSDYDTVSTGQPSPRLETWFQPQQIGERNPLLFKAATKYLLFKVRLTSAKHARARGSNDIVIAGRALFGPEIWEFQVGTGVIVVSYEFHSQVGIGFGFAPKHWRLENSQELWRDNAQSKENQAQDRPITTSIKGLSRLEKNHFFIPTWPEPPASRGFIEPSNFLSPSLIWTLKSSHPLFSLRRVGQKPDTWQRV